MILTELSESSLALFYCDLPSENDHSFRFSLPSQPLRVVDEFATSSCSAIAF